MFKKIIPQDTLNTLQEHQNYMNNILNNIFEQEHQRQENIEKAFENIEFYTLEDFKNELLPILKNMYTRLLILEDKYNIVNNIN